MKDNALADRYARLASYSDFRRIAQSRLPPLIFDYFEGGAGDEITLRENEAAFARLGLEVEDLAERQPVDARAADLRCG